MHLITGHDQSTYRHHFYQESEPRRDKKRNRVVSHYSERMMFIWCTENVYNQLPCISTECLLEEGTSVAAARKLSTLLRKCSVRGGAGTNPAFCAVSLWVLRSSCHDQADYECVNDSELTRRDGMEC